MERKGNGRRRGNKAVWPYMRSSLIQTEKEERLVLQNAKNIQNGQSV